MNFQEFKDIVNTANVPDSARVYLEQELANDVYIQTWVDGTRVEVDDYGSCFIIMGNKGDQD